MKNEMYFAYGSNINMKQMKQRCPSAKLYSKAILQGYQIIFPIFSKKWGGGVAGICLKKGRQVEGVVYKMSKEDLKKLDRFEGVDKGYYYRKKVKVIIENGSILETWTYFPNIDYKSSFPPSKKYLKKIFEGAKEHGLSKKHLKYLRDLLTKSTSPNTK
jgi:gamma-glutamylcyclotransferase (GGCT)/AIG2-like uncharacterized protein YtfP